MFNVFYVADCEVEVSAVAHFSFMFLYSPPDDDDQMSH